MIQYGVGFADLKNHGVKRFAIVGAENIVEMTRIFNNIHGENNVRVEVICDLISREVIYVRKEVIR